MADLVPEPGGMVEVTEMRELVEDDVVANLVGDLDQAPVEGDAAAGGAGAPAGALVSDLHGRGLESVKGGKLVNPMGELPGGEGAKGAFDVGTQVVFVGFRLGDGQVAQEDARAIRGAHDGGGEAPEPHGHAEEPFARGRRAEGAPGEA